MKLTIFVISFLFIIALVTSRNYRDLSHTDGNLFHKNLAASLLQRFDMAKHWERKRANANVNKLILTAL